MSPNHATPKPPSPHVSPRDPPPVPSEDTGVPAAAPHRHWLAGAYPQFAVPYFVYDVYAMFLCHWHRGHVKGHEAGPPPSLRAAAGAYLHKDLLMVLHHAATVLVCFPVATLWRQGKGDFFLGCLLMAELSTPFVCLGKVLILYKRQHTALHKLNGVAMLVTFLGCRVLLFPYLYWAYGRHLGVPLLRVPGALPAAYNAATLLAPQLYWFGLICRGAWRLFQPPPRHPP
ncbi:ceramide synthase [Cygnus olor]|uniref:ceramide synthase n=1 Tax=Cygnus olor TaxID=8869 RepID=UPI001ADE10C5|nr:ceramide synthase [Cygnus olor]